MTTGNDTHGNSTSHGPQYVFGPVPSRRLGRSLGVDLVPMKTCPFDCLYCQLGCTTCCSVERREWVPVEEVLRHLRPRLAAAPDYITLSGSGEPTLYSRIGDLIEGIRAMTDIPVAVLTNGALLWQPEVRRDLAGAHLVVPSLDACDEATFRAVNRPHSSLSYQQLVNGLIALREEFQGQFWLEVFLLEGHTATAEAVRALAGQVRRIRPHRVQLNTVTRPPADAGAVAVDRARMDEFARYFDPPAEVIADFRTEEHAAQCRAGCGDVLHLLQRRPCTVEDIARGLGIHVNETLKYVEELLARNEIEACREQGRHYYRPARAGMEPCTGDS